MNVEDRQLLATLEHIQSPLLLRFPRLHWLGVLDYSVVDSVGVSCQGARQLETHSLLLISLGVILRLSSRLGASLGPAGSAS